MMKFTKTLVAMILVLSMVLSMASMAMAEESAAAGTIKIGLIGPLTGAAASYGTSVKQGAEVAIEEVNALGGVQLELNPQDDEHEAE